VNVVQSASSQQSRGEKKNKNKPKKNNNQIENQKTQAQPPANEKKTHRKPKFTCLICVEDHIICDHFID
jgi:hypothetical protein